MTGTVLASRFFVEAREVEVAMSGEGLGVPWRPILLFGLVILVTTATMLDEVGVPG